MNPSKCAFGVSLRNFLGFLVHHREIDFDPIKAKAIVALSPPKTLKELRSFVGKFCYLRRFILGLVEILKPLVEQTMKGVCRHHILYPLQLGPPFPNNTRTLRPKVNLEPNQILN